MMPRRPMTCRIGCDGTTGNAARFRRVSEKVHSRLLREYRARYLGPGVLNRLPMFSEILEDGVRWPDGTIVRVDVILWCTGFRRALDHLAPLMIREPGGGITVTGKLLTQVAKDPRVHLVGYGPSASTIGANRAGAAAARELMAFLGEG